MGWKWGESCHKEGEGYSEMAPDTSLYSAKINSKEHNIFMVLMNTEFRMALTDTSTSEGKGGRDRVQA